MELSGSVVDVVEDEEDEFGMRDDFSDESSFIGKNLFFDSLKCVAELVTEADKPSIFLSLRSRRSSSCSEDRALG
jgi:hypothetical protein